MRQKIFSVTTISSLSLVFALCFLWLLHTESLVELSSASNKSWQQPVAISDSFPDEISSHYWPFNFDATEAQLLNIKYDQVGELILNEAAAKQLENAVSSLPKKLDLEALQRLELLVEKGWSGNSGKQLATVLVSFYHFQQASNIATLSTSTKSTSTKSQEQQFQEAVQRQEYYLGKDLANKLFGRKNAVNYYLYARKAINENLSLSSAQKQEQLSKLQSRFKENGE